MAEGGHQHPPHKFIKKCKSATFALDGMLYTISKSLFLLDVPLLMTLSCFRVDVPPVNDIVLFAYGCTPVNCLVLFLFGCTPVNGDFLYIFTLFFLRCIHYAFQITHCPHFQQFSRNVSSVYTGDCSVSCLLLFTVVVTIVIKVYTSTESESVS